MHVTPTYNSIQVCDPDALMEIFRRKHGFPRPLHFYNGDQWKRRRKSAASCFNEPNNEIVWSGKPSPGRRHDTLLGIEAVDHEHCRRLAHAFPAYPVPSRLREILQVPGLPGEDCRSRSYELQGVPENRLGQELLDHGPGNQVPRQAVAPASLRRVHQAIVAFHQYMTQVYEEEKRSMAQNGETNRTLMSTLVRASAEETDPATRLTERELYGNMSIFNFAGHDTTTHSIVFSLMHLAINPDAQEWISEEICSVFGDSPVSEWDYSSFPRLKRCVVVLMESLCLYTLVPMSKWTDARAQQLTVGRGKKSITIPPKTTVLVAYAAVHTHPDYWGPDALEWRPSRWIKRSSDAGDEELITPRRGTYVEFAATMAALFRDYRVGPTKRQGESEGDARRRIAHQLETDSAKDLLLQMLHPERAALSWRNKGGMCTK
ncbi:uncharacterized protein PG986_006557 [Apiospora aurea]|uniref:Cytochrome P450 n=1 Tax=Apiospora aurea TaxID=335848 RepID=A0ABR1QKS4_9PEZI